LKLEEFKGFIKALHNAFGKSTPSAEVLDFLYDKIGKIPGPALEWMEERFLSINEKFPSKLHPAIMACWWDYLREHPDQRAMDREKKECPYCTDGMLFLAKYEPLHGRMTEYSANCGHCRQRADEKNIPMMTRDQALKRGYSILDEDGNERAKPGGPSMWRSVASDAIAGRETPDERRADLR
jgi:hypothetical protein